MTDTQSGGVVSRVAGWMKMPFSQSMSVWGWVLFLGLVIIIVMGWREVLKHITEL